MQRSSSPAILRSRICALASVLAIASVGALPSCASNRAAASARAPGEAWSSLEPLFGELEKKWPKNRLVRLVFHGHSVPAGYFRTPTVRRLSAYPMQLQQMLCDRYPTAVIDVSVTAIGGENSEQGSARFARDVLALRPNLVFLDYALNDRRLGLERTERAWRSMIESCRARAVPVVLLTATPDQRTRLMQDTTMLAQHCAQIRNLAKEYRVPCVDSYARFRELVRQGRELRTLMAQSNHPNARGHAEVADLLFALLERREPLPSTRS